MMTTVQTPSGTHADRSSALPTPTITSPIDASSAASASNQSLHDEASLTYSSFSPEANQAPSQRPPGRSVLSALSISLYESMSFSRSPSFERTRYIVSTCTFITIIYLRTLHCLFFGTGALSCAVLAKCLKHTIRQPRPHVARVEDEDELSVYTAIDPVTAPPPSSSSRTVHSRTSTIPTATEAGETTPQASQVTLNTKISADLDCETVISEAQLHASILRTSSPTLSLAPATTLQQQLVDHANAEKPTPSSSSQPASTAATTSTTTPTTTTTTKPKIRRLRLQNRHRRKILFRVDYGMPSSHAQLVAFFVCYISLQLILTMEADQGAFGQWFLILLLQLYAWSVVWSRVRLGRHTVAQVLVGAAVGAVYGIVWFTLWCWKVEAMIQEWQWMDRYGVIQVRKMWRQLEMEGARLDGRGMMFQPMLHQHHHQHHHHRNPRMPTGF